TNIANELADQFKKANISAYVEPTTGNVLLDMGEDFLFKKNSYILNRRAKKTIKKIIPIYSKVLFGSSEIKDKIESFNVVGHASPTHRGRYVDPGSTNSRAYSYNMFLSAQRASSISTYIFSSRTGKFNYKSTLQRMTRSIGKGYSSPIKLKARKGRSLASLKKKSKCKEYHCKKSQRVELSFTLKDDIKSINDLIKMSKENK
ncbi:hypothetical protein N9N67_12105, partial [Bacteriovoracaceae bacterium]|nr:hypothetical protein [Bacteriovoracaceae bacterium]